MNLFIFGLGYIGLALARAVRADGIAVAGTVRGGEKATRLSQEGIEAYRFDGTAPIDPAHWAQATHIVSTIGPDATGAVPDPVLRHHGADIAASGARWLGYLSATSVYGDRQGALTDEEAPCRPASERGAARLAAERAWQAAVGERLRVFRLAGIYGPGRSAIDALRSGRARRIVKPGHVTNRIHVDDVVAVLLVAMDRPEAIGIFNLADDEPAPSAEVTSHAAALLGMAPPPAVNYAESDLSPMAASFYEECKRVDNRRIKRDLGARLAYPGYREGLAAILAGEGSGQAV